MGRMESNLMPSSGADTDGQQAASAGKRQLRALEPLQEGDGRTAGTKNCTGNLRSQLDVWGFMSWEVKENYGNQQVLP